MVNLEYILSVGFPERFYIVYATEGENRLRTTPRVLLEELKKKRAALR